MKQAVGKHEDIVWFHCASLGEFEQGRPIIEAFKQTFPQYKVLLTFFSPSGYELRKNYGGADYIFYLPIDKPKNARRFIRIFRPKLAVFIKYEYWYNYIKELSKNKIPLFFVSAIFRPNQYFFRPGAAWFQHQLQKVTWFQVQDKASSDLLNKIRIYHHQVGGDTRFDRVLKVARENVSLPVAARFAQGNNLLIGGSTWPPDETILADYLRHNSTIKMILAPHKTNREHIEEIKNKFADFYPVLYSEAEKELRPENRVLVIDSIGLLSHLYRFGKIAYVGGGFGVGIHNLPEAAVYGIPVLFGPHHERFREALDLIACGGGFAISDAESFRQEADRLLQQPEAYDKAAHAAKNYVKQQAGATYLAIEKFKEYIVVQQKEKSVGNL
jgi:3-deoxy-D-manno-octulosonic-acid transferase